VEAMASGTPVIAFRRGSMTELVDDGHSGALVEDVEGAAAAVASVPLFDRGAIRDRAVARFSRDRMTAEYLAAYFEILNRAS
jgi:glycosyltransferase involved in cell wall biosynthesis